MDSNNNELSPIDELCFICLTEKYMHLEHCKVCNKCVKNFHFHSKYFNTCFGDANIRPYILFLLLSLASSVIYLIFMGKYYWRAAAEKSDISLGRFMVMHSEMDIWTLLAYIQIELYFLVLLDRCVTVINALGRNLTTNEYMKAGEYRYLFKADVITKRNDGKAIKNVHK